MLSLLTSTTLRDLNCCTNFFTSSNGIWSVPQSKAYFPSCPNLEPKENLDQVSWCSAKETTMTLGRQLPKVLIVFGRADVKGHLPGKPEFLI